MGTRWLTAKQQQSWRAYLIGSARLTERLEHDLRAHGLSLSEYEILVRLSEAPERTLRMAELAESVHHSRSRLTHAITRMERSGAIKRRHCDQDRRGVWAQLTEEGYARLVEIAPVHVQSVREAFVDLVDPDDFEAIGRAFRLVAEHTKCPTAASDED